MALAGLGAVAIWHDIAPEGRDNFYAWHGNEHMLERIAIPGFLRGRRYVSMEGSPEFFNLYETESPDVVTGSAYLERLNHPTAWTTKSVTDFRNVSRSLCSVAATFGKGQGGLIGTFRYSLSYGLEAEHRRYMSAELLPRLEKSAGVAGCHLLCADEQASAVKTAEKNVRREDNLIPPWILLIEGWGDQKPFSDLCRSQLAEENFADAMPRSAALSLYRLQTTVVSGARG